MRVKAALNCVPGICGKHNRAALSVLILLWFTILVLLLHLTQNEPRDRILLHDYQVRQRRIPSKSHFQVVDLEDGKTWPYRVFKSDKARPPRVDIVRRNGELSQGYFFVNAQLILSNGELDRTPYIFSTDGELVFAVEPVDGTATGNFRVQEYHGRPHLTTWRGTLTSGAQVGHAYGSMVMFDENYDETIVGLLDESINANMVGVSLLSHMDLHEQRTTDWGSVLVSVYNATTANASHVGGSEQQAIFDGLVYEIDVATLEILWTWSALDHIPLQDSYLPFNVSVHGKEAESVPWDGYHLNSVDPAGPDHFLISVRSTWSIYLVNRHSKRIVWTLHGDGAGDFGRLPDNGSFRWQHDARVLQFSQDRMIISLFDNHRNSSKEITVPSRGLVLDLALPPDPTKSPNVVRSTHVENDTAAWQGNYQARLSNGNEFLSYGDKTYVVEFGPGPDGARQEVWRARFGFDRVVPTYRGWKSPWTGTPRRWHPSLVVEVDEYDGSVAKVTAYVSWNGATDVVHWQLYSDINGGPNLEKVGIVAKKGFETMFETALGREGCMQIAAVLSTGVERLSNLVCL